MAASEPIEDVKAKLQVKEGIPNDQQHIRFSAVCSLSNTTTKVPHREDATKIRIREEFNTNIVVETFSHNYIHLRVRREDFILHIKYAIKNHLDIMPEYQILKFKDSILDDFRTLSHYNITEGSALKLEVKRSYMPEGKLFFNFLF